MPLTEPMCEINGQFARLRVKMLLAEAITVCLLLSNGRTVDYYIIEGFSPRQLHPFFHVGPYSVKMKLKVSITYIITRHVSTCLTRALHPSLSFPLCPFRRGRVSRLVEILISLKNKIK